MLLREHFAQVPRFTLSLSCSFFGYFAHCGALQALHEAGLRPTAVTGASAGAVVAGLYGAGYEPDEMEAVFCELDFGTIFSFRPTVYWGFPVVGLFRQNLGALEALLLVDRPMRLEDARLPVALSAYDVDEKQLKVLRTGRLTPAIAASASVPGLMHGILDEETGHRLVDAGVGGDYLGVAGCGAADDVLVVNLFLRAFLPRTPEHLARSVTVDLFGVPFVTPASMRLTGPLARDAAYRAMKQALDSELPDSQGARRLAIRPPEEAGPSARAEPAEFAACGKDKDDDAAPTKERRSSFFDLWRS